MSKVLIYPSLAVADQLNLQREIERLEIYVDGFHIDIMDDHFVPNLAMSIDTTNRIAGVTKKPLFVHLMVEYVEELVERLTLPAGTLISFHSHQWIAEEQETVPGTWTILTADITGLLQKIKRKDWQISIALSPGQPVSTIEPLLDQLDNVLVMSVMPGFAGQDFMPASLNAIDELIVHRRERNLKFTIAIDGGIDAKNIGRVTEVGAEIVCIGSGIYGTDDPVKATELIRAVLN